MRVSLLLTVALACASVSPQAAAVFVLDQGGGDGSVVDFSNSSGFFPRSFSLVGSDSLLAGSVVTTYTATATADLLIEGEFAYLSADIGGPGFDPFGYIINGTQTQLTDNAGGPSQTGTFTFSVLAGDIFGWYIDATDDQLGAASAVVGATVVPLPAALPLLLTAAFAGFAVTRRRTGSAVGHAALGHA